MTTHYQTRATRKTEPPEQTKKRRAPAQATTQSSPFDAIRGHAGNNDPTSEMTMPPTCTYPQITYPAWPTSQPGPAITLPPLGQKPHPLRTDQMVYESYDQELGKPGVIPPAPPVPKWQKPGTALPKIDQRESEALEIWLDDGGTLGS